MFQTYCYSYLSKTSKIAQLKMLSNPCLSPSATIRIDGVLATWNSLPGTFFCLDVPIFQFWIGVCLPHPPDSTKEICYGDLVTRRSCDENLVTEILWQKLPHTLIPIVFVKLCPPRTDGSFLARDTSTRTHRQRSHPKWYYSSREFSSWTSSRKLEAPSSPHVDRGCLNTRDSERKNVLNQSEPLQSYWQQEQIEMNTCVCRRSPAHFLREG